jgi:hypothetical protein
VSTVDLKNFLPERTLVFENVPDLSGDTKNPDGAPRVWTIRPLTVERELAVEKARLENSTRLQNVIANAQRRWKAVEDGRDPSSDPVIAAEDEEDPVASAEQWAPIVAAMVAEPELDAEELETNFHGLLLRHVGERAEAFFRDGPPAKENRESRRMK